MVDGGGYNSDDENIREIRARASDLSYFVRRSNDIIWTDTRSLDSSLYID